MELTNEHFDEHARLVFSTRRRRLGLTFVEMLTKSSRVLHEAMRIMPEEYRFTPPRAPIDELIDQACIPPEELERRHFVFMKALEAIFYETVWTRLPKDEEYDDQEDVMHEEHLRKCVPLVFERQE